MFLLNILEAVLAYDLVKIRFIKEKEVILNGNTNDKSRGIQLIGPGYLQKVIKGVKCLLSPILPLLLDFVPVANTFHPKHRSGSLCNLTRDTYPCCWGSEMSMVASHLNTATK